MSGLSHIATALDLDMRAFWTPDAAFLSRLTKSGIAEVLGESGCAAEAVRAMEKAPKGEGNPLPLHARSPPARRMYFAFCFWVWHEGSLLPPTAAAQYLSPSWHVKIMNYDPKVRCPNLPGRA
ncbi:hypothetical protein ACOJBM_00490 [Rhizobium beringeri]|uniref:hypothetical protein n=1 Tax=Rhizobium TaxID=379 RepID=UPI0012DB56A0|nr:hypothetical protein [Rhizobium leguminosarum]